MPPKPQLSTEAKYAVTSLVLGIVGIVGSCIPCLNYIVGWAAPIGAIVFGFLGLKSEKRPLALAGIIMGIAWLVILVILVVLVFVFGFWSTLMESVRQ